MHVLADLPDRLLMEERPLALSLGLGGGLAALTAAGMSQTRGIDEMPATLAGVALLGLGMSVVLERASLALDRGDRPGRGDGLVRLERVGVFGGRRLARPLSALRRAEVESTTDDSGELNRHRMVLRFAGGHAVPTSRAFVPGPGAREAAATVNRWLSRTRWDRRAG